jgi:hypothetical protein
MAAVLYVDPAAPIVAADVAARAEATASLSAPPVSGPVQNKFDGAIRAFFDRAAATDESVSAIVRRHASAVGAQSAAGFNAIADMETQNTADLAAVDTDQAVV